MDQWFWRLSQLREEQTHQQEGQISLTTLHISTAFYPIYTQSQTGWFNLVLLRRRIPSMSKQSLNLCLIYLYQIQKSICGLLITNIPPTEWSWANQDRMSLVQGKILQNFWGKHKPFCSTSNYLFLFFEIFFKKILFLPFFVLSRK